MITTKFTAAMVTTSLLLAAITFGSAHAEIVQCVERDGGVLFTDRECAADAQQLDAAGEVDNAPAASVKQPALAEKAAKKQGPRALPTDVSTMKAAKTAFTLLDQSASWERQQKLARLN